MRFQGPLHGIAYDKNEISNKTEDLEENGH